MTTSLADYVEYLPTEGPRLRVRANGIVILDVTPTTFNGIPLTGRWQLRNAEEYFCFSDFAEWGLGRQFSWNTLTYTLNADGPTLGFPTFALGMKFDTLLMRLFIEPRVMCNPECNTELLTEQIMLILHEPVVA